MHEANCVEVRAVDEAVAVPKVFGKRFKPSWIPTVAEIEIETALIRAGWSEADYRYRATGVSDHYRGTMTVPQCRAFPVQAAGYIDSE